MKISQLNTTKEFIAKLNKLNITKFEDKKLIAEFNGKELSISYNLKVNVVRQSNCYPIQVVANIRVDGFHVQSWGCMDNEDNELVLTWFIRKEREVRDNEYEIERVKRNEAESFIDAL